MVVETAAGNEEDSAALLSEGWERCATYSEPRLSELVDMYRELGFEVYLKPFNPDEETGCTECLKVSPEKYKTVYIKKTSSSIDLNP